MGLCVCVGGFLIFILINIIKSQFICQLYVVLYRQSTDDELDMQSWYEAKLL